VIYDDAIDIFRVEGIIATLGSFRLVLIPQSEAQITDDHIRGVLDLKRIVAEGDTVARSSLARNRDVGLVQHQLFLQLDGS